MEDRVREVESLDAQIACLALRIHEERSALQRDRVVVQAHLRKFLRAPPFAALGLSAVALIAWRKFRRL
jgi:hypothetical protein